MRPLVSFVFWLFLATSSVPLFGVALVVFALTLPFDRNAKLLHLYSCAWAQLYFAVNPWWRLRVDGRSKLPWRSAAVLVANHESLADILVLFGLFRPFKWVSKRSAFNLPFIGWNMWLNRYVPLVRGDRTSVTRMLETCERWLRRGVPVLLFPEGTRSEDGNVKAFKEGAFYLAVRTGAPVIPIALSGTGRTLPKHGWVLRESARCKVRVLDPVDPKAFNGDASALSAAVRERIIEAKRSLDG